MTTKAIKLQYQDSATPAALLQWKTDSAKRIVLLTNTSGQDIRIDKITMTVSAKSNVPAGSFAGLHTIVHLSDSLGNYLDTTNWAFTTAQMESQCQQWKEKIWMNDFRILGSSGTDSEEVVTYFELTANTSRLLSPGESVAISFATFQSAGTLANGPSVFVDCMFWYS